MSNFRKSILIFGAVLLCVCAALATFLILSFSGALVTEPIELVYQIVDERKYYDGEPLTPQECFLMSGNLIEGHVAEITLDGSQTTAGTSKSGATVKIFDEDGYDVTKDYKIRVEGGTLTVNRQELRVKLNGEQVVYGGEKVIFDDYSVVYGSLASGHVVGAMIAGNGLVNVGEELTNSDVFPAIYDALGRDVTANYELLFAMDPVRIVPRPITITPVSVDKIYDGEPADFKTEITAGTLVSGHYCTYTYTDSRGEEVELKNAGSVEVLVSARVHDALGNDVTANYLIDDGTAAVLTVRKRALTVTAESRIWEYDGKLHSSDGAATNEETAPALAEGLASGESVQVVYSGSLTTPGERANEIRTCRVLGKDGFETTSNYEITYISGKLTVTKASLTVTLADIKKDFDGKPATKPKQSDYYTEFKPALPEGVTFESNVEEVLSSVTTGQNRRYTFTDYTVKNDDENLTDYYEVTAVSGTVNIAPKKVTVSATGSGTLYTEYNGTFCNLPQNSFKAEGLLAGHTILSVTGDKILEPASEEMPIGVRAVRIADADGNDVTDGYEFTDLSKITVKVVVGKKKVTVSVLDYACEYGTEITTELLKSLLVCEEHYTAADFAFDFNEKNAGTYSVKPEFVGEESDMYEPRVIAGTLTIQPRKIPVSVVRGDKVYDGFPFGEGEIELNCNLPEGVTADFNRNVKDAGSYTDIFFFENGERTANYEADVTGSYNIAKRTAYLKYGDLSEDMKAPVSKTYDGTPFTVDYKFLGLYGANGEKLNAFEITSITYDQIIRVKTQEGQVEAQPLNLRYPKAVLKGGDGSEVSSDNLEIIILEEDAVSVTVNRRAITFTVAPLVLPKDATINDIPDDLTSLVTVNGVASTDRIVSRIYNVSADLDGVMVSRRTAGTIYNALGDNVTDCYTITAATGVVTLI